ncbi:MAG: rod shape-determining protein, partial [Elusimicrobia bacterium]|nr:rod shape-determining protein [Elusimicrobiota bacterium]
MRQALLEPVHFIIEMIRDTLEDTPARLSADLVDRGMVLAGGGCLLRGLPDLVRQETGAPVRRAADPLGCVAL